MIYALSIRYYMPLVGRLVSGVGASFGSAVYTEVKRVTDSEERNRVLIIMEGVRLVGIVLGPGMNFFLKNFDLKLGPWVIDAHTAPGFFMALIWLIVQIVHIFIVFDLDEDHEAYHPLPSDAEYEDATPFPERKAPAYEHETAHDEEKPSHAEGLSTHAEGESIHAKGESVHGEDESTHAEDESTHAKDQSTHAEDDDKSSVDEDESMDDEVVAKSDKITMYGDDNGNVQKMPLPENVPLPSGTITPLFDALPGNEEPSLLSMLGRRDVMLILVTQFLMFLNQTAFETLVLLIGVEKLDFDINVLSGVFILAGVEMVIVIIIVWSANKTLDAKYLLLTSLSSGILASFARLAVTFTKPHSAGCLAMTLLMACFTIIGTPITSISGKSILPKITRPEHHGFYQSAFAASQHLGLITGPLVASVMYNYLVLFSSLMVVIFLVVYLIAMKVVEKLAIPAYGCGK